MLVARIVTGRLNVKPRSEHVQREPPSKNRLEKQTKELRANLTKLQKLKNGMIKKKEQNRLNERYKVNQKGLSVAH